MNETAPRVIKIPAKPESVRQAELQRQLRVAAYCRVSTKEEDQTNSYEVQKEYYTDKIMSNPVWTMAGIFADKGTTGTSVKKREDFMRMIRHCRQRKIDVVLTKSVSRFARNTVDCLYYTRALKELGIAVIFEKENIHSLEEDSELRITLSGAFAQSESESISANVTWGKRRAMESGKATIQYKYLYHHHAGGIGQVFRPSCGVPHPAGGRFSLPAAVFPVRRGVSAHLLRVSVCLFHDGGGAAGGGDVPLLLDG